MKEAIQKYSEFMIREELAEGTRSIYLRQAKKLIHYIGRREPSKELMIQYKEELNHTNLAVATINLYLLAINKFLRYLGYEECCIKLYRIQKKRSVTNVISIEEYKGLAEYARGTGREKYYYIIRTLANTGIRISELQYFTVEAVNVGTIHINNKGKSREIYIPEKLIQELKEYCLCSNIKSGYIFLGRSSRPISRIAVYKMLIQLTDRIGIPKEKAHPHSFRHMFAISYMNSYHNLSELADILGHSSMETTRIYATTTAEEKRVKIGKLGLL